MDEPTTPPTEPPARGPGPVSAFVQATAGLLVPLLWLWVVRPWVVPESEREVRLRTGRPAYIAGWAVFRAIIGACQTQAGVLVLDWIFFRSFQSVPPALSVFGRAMKLRLRFERAVYSLIGTLFVIGFSLLPLTALLVAMPAVAPS